MGGKKSGKKIRIWRAVVRVGSEDEIRNVSKGFPPPPGNYFLIEREDLVEGMGGFMRDLVEAALAETRAEERVTESSSWICHKCYSTNPHRSRPNHKLTHACLECGWPRPFYMIPDCGCIGGEYDGFEHP